MASAWPAPATMEWQSWPSMWVYTALISGSSTSKASAVGWMMNRMPPMVTGPSARMWSARWMEGSKAAPKAAAKPSIRALPPPWAE